ncbi:MAG: glycosyltransferase family 2 protein [Bacteroidaceae bacterium]|nr:glycosyltransferase family 2 protein [Bacteroidaceae bacterium]
MPRVSIIVPVYNAENYIVQCLDSILNQTFQDFEVIIVDDGSTDNSAKICNKYAEQDHRIILIKKSNGGVSAARNIAISQASGEWITFLDADDMLFPDCLEQCVSIMEIKKLDLLQFSLSRTYDRSINNALPPDIHVYNSSDFFSVMHNVSAGGSFIKLSTLLDNNIRFNETIKLAEDQLFILNVIKNSNRISIIPSVLYYYRLNENSATHTSREDDVLRTCHVLYIEKMAHPEFVHQVDNTILNLVFNMVVYSRNKTNIDQIIKLYKKANIKYCDRVPLATQCFYWLSCFNVQFAVFVSRLYYN